MRSAAPGVGHEVGGYRLDEQLGEGGMGVVYSATHTVIGKKAAVKLMRARLCTDDESVKRFFNEAVLTASIRHPGIVEIFDYGVHESGSAFIAMALLDGDSLETRLRDRGALRVIDALRISRQIASALAAAHAEGVVHRDLKPDNVFLVADSEVPGGERTQLLDFGIAKLLGDEDASAALTQTGTVLGTPLYMSPEQCRGRSDLDGRTDLYALGCMLYQMLAGRPPFSGESALEVGAAHVRDQPTPLTEICEGLAEPIAELVHHLLEKKREDRPESATVVADRLTNLISTIETSPLSGRHSVATIPMAIKESAELELAETIGATDEDAEPLEAPRGRRRAVALAIFAGVVAAAGATTWALVPAKDHALAPAFELPDGCPADAQTCRRFADVLWRGDGMTPDLARARSILADGCEKGDDVACLQEVIVERRAYIPMSRKVTIGSPSGTVDVVMAIDYAAEDAGDHIARIYDIEDKLASDVRIHIAPIGRTEVGRILGTTACLLIEEQAFAVFATSRESFIRGGISAVPPPQVVVQLAGGDPEAADRRLAACSQFTEKVYRAMDRHRASSGTLFISGKRLDPPFSDQAVEAHVAEAIEFHDTREGRIISGRDRVGSSRVRYDIVPTITAHQPVQMITYCDIGDAACQASYTIHGHLPNVFGIALQTDLRPIFTLGEPERSIAACVLMKLNLLPTLLRVQRETAKIDGKLRRLTAEEVLDIARGAKESEAVIAKHRDSTCPADFERGQAELRAATGGLIPVTFVNGRPAEYGRVTDIRALIDEELQFAERVKDQSKRDALLKQYDSGLRRF